MLPVRAYLVCFTGVSIDEITMVIVVDGDVITERNRRNSDIERMQELICTPVSVLCVSYIYVHV